MENGNNRIETNLGKAIPSKQHTIATPNAYNPTSENDTGIAPKISRPNNPTQIPPKKPIIAALERSLGAVVLVSQAFNLNIIGTANLVFLSVVTHSRGHIRDR